MMLDVKNICIEFPGFSLDQVSLCVAESEYHMLLGPSGSGKTLLMNIIAGFHKPISGTILYQGNDITDFTPQMRKIAYLLQDLALFPHMTVRENVSFPLCIAGTDKKLIDARVKKYLDFTEVPHLVDRNIVSLSGGEKQRVALARILITETPLIMLDEPFSALDTQLRLSLKKLLKKISDSGISVLHVTHNLDEAINLADRITVIENGIVTASGFVNEVINEQSSKFLASFSGQKNYFYLIDEENVAGTSFVVVSPDKNGEQLLRLVVSGSYPDKARAVIIDSNSMILSEEKITSSARNIFKAVIVSVFRNPSGYDIELLLENDSLVDNGIHLWASITSHSFLELRLGLHKTVWISFKASSVKFV